jgi:hypothetical protein
MTTRTLVLSLFALSACGGGEGTWSTEIYGEPFIEEGMAASDFADGCSAQFSKVLVVVSDAALVDGDDADAVALGTARVFDLVQPGPHAIADLTAPDGFYDTARFVIAPATNLEAGNASADDVASMAGQSIRAVGDLTCDGTTKSFDWTFDTATTYNCELEDLTIPAGGTDRTELTFHGDHFFYDGLENADAEVRGMAIHGADADGDDVITQAELAMVDVATLGYQVGQFSSVTDLGAFISHLTTNTGHVDGEGHCDVTR